MMKLELIDKLWNAEEDELFKQWLKVSAMLHISIVLAWGLKSFILPSKVINVPNAIKVDMVGLPDKPEPVKKAEPKPQPKPKPKPKEKPKPKPDKTKSQQQKALEKLNQLAAIDKIKQQAEADNKEDSPEEVKPNTPEYKGNLITSGNSFTGLSGIAAQEYWSDVKMHLQNYWALPEWLANTPLRASVAVMIDDSGHVRKAEIYKSSGNQAFDDAALSAVEAASPFPVPPERLKDIISDSWISFNFPE